MRRIALSAALFACASSVPARAAAPAGGIETAGASITAGTGAAMPLQWRIERHLLVNGVDAPALTGGKRVLIAYDYFFPTNFAALDQGPAAAAALARAKLAEWSSSYDYVLVGDLIDRDSLAPEKRAMLDAAGADPAFENLRNVYGWLYKTSPTRARAAEAVTRVIRDAASADPGRVFVIRSADFVDLLDLGAKGYVAGGSRVSPPDLFADAVHFNDYGQAFLFNQAIRPALDRIAGLEGKIPPMPFEELDSAAVDEARRRRVEGPEAFAAGRTGSFWAMMDGLSPVGYALESVYDTVVPWKTGISNPLARANGRLTVPPGAEAEYAAQIERLREIRSMIAKASFLAQTGFTVSVKDTPQGLAIGLDLTQVLFYTQIFASDAGGGRYVGYGYDFWSSVDSRDPPVTNYVFEIRRDPADAGALRVAWTIVPLMRSGTARQAARLVREPFLAPEWVEEYETRADRYPSLRYEFKLRIVKL